MHTHATFWGEVTSTLDWCEENYAVSPYFAELINTTTNVAFFVLPLFGVYNTYKERLQPRFFFTHLCIMLIGIGSWWFHMTLKYEMQLLDELPMIYGSCFLLWIVFETYPNYKYGLKLPLGLFAYAVFVTYSYLILQNPVFHQVCYGLLVVCLVFRSTYMVQTMPDSPNKPLLLFVLRSGAGIYLLGFFLWNIDNQFCEDLKGFRGAVGWPWGIVSELHGWWHIFTALGTYYYVCFSELTHEILIGNGKDFELIFVAAVIPYVRRVPKEMAKKLK